MPTNVNAERCEEALDGALEYLGVALIVAPAVIRDELIDVIARTAVMSTVISMATS